MIEIFNSPFIVPLGGMTMALLITVAAIWGKTRQKEIQSQHDLELRRMEHERQMMELEIQKTKTGSES